MRFNSFEELLGATMRQQSRTDPALYDEKHSLSCRELLELVQTRAESLRASGKSCLGVLTDGSLNCVVEIFAANIAGLQNGSSG